MDSHWNVNELDEITDETHDGKANGNCSTNLQELCNALKYLP